MILPRVLSSMTQEEETGVPGQAVNPEETNLDQITRKQYSNYLVYNTTDQDVQMTKGELLGHCQLVLQESADAFRQELGAMDIEAEAERRELAEMKKEQEGRKDPTEEKKTIRLRRD